MGTRNVSANCAAKRMSLRPSGAAKPAGLNLPAAGMGPYQGFTHGFYGRENREIAAEFHQIRGGRRLA